MSGVSEFEFPWPVNQLKKLSKALRDGQSTPPATPAYDDVMGFYDDVAFTIQTELMDQDWTSLLGNRVPEITSRSKTLDTLTQKLRRDPGTPLPSVQDVAGIRFEAEMSLSEQDAVAQAICGLFDQPATCIKDLRTTPHSGYRAVHLWLRLPVRAEVQIRTHLQGSWANAYEAAADVIGRDIRYGELPSNPELRHFVEELKKASFEWIANLEVSRDELDAEEASLADSAGPNLNWLVHPDVTPIGVIATNKGKIDQSRALLRKRECEIQQLLEQIRDSFNRAKEG